VLAPVAAALLAALLGPVPREPILSYAPSPVTLGLTSAVRIRVRLAGATAAAPEPRLQATEGTLSALARVGAEEWTATLALPRGGPPLLVIVSAVREEPGADPEVAFLAIPVRGRASVPVETEPGARVWLSAGGEEVGPVTAGPGGLATISVAVPPGVRKATVRATGRGGHTERTVALDVPPPRRLALIATAVGDGLARLDLFVAGAGDVDVEASGARVSVPEPVPGQPGRLTASLSGQPGPVAVRAEVRGDPASRATAEIVLPGERAPTPAPHPATPAPAPPEPAAAPAAEEAAPEEPPPPPAPAQAVSAALGVRARPNDPAGAEARLGWAYRFAAGARLSAGLAASLWIFAVEQPSDPVLGTAGTRVREVGLLPEAYGRMELPGLFLQAAAGPGGSLACASAGGGSSSCSGVLSVSFRAGAGFRLPAGEGGREVALTAEWSVREAVAGSGLARESGELGGMGVLLGVSVGTRWDPSAGEPGLTGAVHGR
jgi:hypothetical protein